MKKNILLEGYPGVGKTTIIKKITAGIGFAGGFYTAEIKEGSTRRGFRIITLEGRQGTLADQEITSPYRVGKYAVHMENLEKIGVKSILGALKDTSKWLVVIDEIGKMELFSSHFREAVMLAFESPKKVLATVPMKTNVFLDTLKSKNEVQIISVTAHNRDLLPNQILAKILMG